MLYSIIIEPIEIIVDWVFCFFMNKFSFLGVIGAIYGVSMVINFLALPLYNVADSLQEKERKISKKLEYRVKRIKKGFKGDEQFMMLSEYYRQNNYHPLYVLRSSLSILIEIPFFIAAYHYLSNLQILKNTSYYFLASLGAPDKLLSFTVGGVLITINLLPIVMTLINFISGYFYTKDATLRDKVQLYAMGIFFLIILYNSPSGLVLYWILNNIFSLCKTVALKTKIANKILLWAIGLNLSVFGVLYLLLASKTIFGYSLVAIGLFLIFISFFKINNTTKINEKSNNNYLLVFFSGLSLALLCGLVIPSSVISTSPVEFSFIGSVDSPLYYIKHAIFVFIGLFVFWPLCISKMFGKRVCSVTSKILSILLIVALFDTFIFKGSFGNLTNRFFLENSSNLSNNSIIDIIGPIVIFIVAIFLIRLLEKKEKNNLLIFLFFSFSIAELLLGIVKINEIKRGYSEYSEIRNENDISEVVEDVEIEPIYNLSNSGNNVVVLFLDRALNQFFAYAIEEVPKLKKQFEGFVYYPNTVSYSSSTITAAPAMMGGYEYTPKKINERSNELLVDKHNEASVVLPKIFNDSGYGISITEPPYPNYSWAGDFSAFSVLQDAYVDEIAGKYRDKYLNEFKFSIDKNPENKTSREAINYSILQILPPIFRRSFDSNFRSKGLGLSGEDLNFSSNFSSLYYLPELCDINSYENQYVFIGNNATHEPTHMDSTFTYPSSELDPASLKWAPNDQYTLVHYESFIAVMKQIGLWLDYLRENNIYDNTRIIIVSDHGRNLVIDDVIDKDRAYYTPLLLYKDFNQNDKLYFDNTFMTNADVPLLAIKDLDVSNINPFTGNKLVSDKSEGLDVFLGDWDGEEYKKLNKTQFNMNTSNFWHIAPGDISKEETWTRLEKIE